MRLGAKQELFSELLVKLLSYMHSEGYSVRIGDVFRDPRVHGVLGEKLAYGHKSSAHKLKLAADLNLFLDGKYLTSDEDHEPFGIYWESLHPLCRWGGRFNDGNHYSLEHNNMK